MHEQGMKSCHGSCKSWGLLALRIAIGVIFVLHGWGKLFGNAPSMDQFTQMVAGLGFIAPAAFAYAAALTEFLGGIAILLGVCTRFFSVLTAIVMFVAFAMVHKFALPLGDADLALLGASVALACVGPGRFALMKGGKGCCKCSCHGTTGGDMKCGCCGGKEGGMKGECCQANKA